MNKTMIKTALLTVALLAVIYRVQPARDALTGDQKLFGLF